MFRAFQPTIRTRRSMSIVLVFFLGVAPASAEEAIVAVAANFADVVEQLKSQFEDNSGHTLTVTIGSTGKLYAQVVNGAPFDVLLAADQVRPARLEQEERAVPGSRFTYAIGRVTLWSADPGRIGTDGAVALGNGFRHLAIANRGLAPYGAAAMEILESLGLAHDLSPKIVMGEDIGQTFALVATGNAELGFVALSYVLAPQNKNPGSRWDVPVDLYTPIRQDAVLLEHGAGNAAAEAFMQFLQSDHARGTIERLGYGLM